MGTNPIRNAHIVWQEKTATCQKCQPYDYKGENQPNLHTPLANF
jgi:hypothetical protein